MFILIFLLVMVLIISFISNIYRKSWSRNLTIDMSFNKDGIFEGEKGELHEIITNKKFIPIWWGNVQFFISNYIQFDDSADMDHDYYKKDGISVLSYEKVTRTLPFTAAKRGYYTVNSAELTTGDLFFRYKFIKKFPVFTEVYVYPAIKDISKFNIDFNKIVGEVITRRHIIEDPFQFRGIRDYYPFDSLKSINWNASAKTGEIKVNEYNYTSSQEVMILLDFDGYNSWDKQAVKEDMIKIGAYLINKLIENGIAAGLISNATDVITSDMVKVPCRNGINHNLFIYKEMAKINTNKLCGEFNDILDEEMHGNGKKPQYILISYYSGINIQRKVNEAKALNLSLKWIVVKDKFREDDMADKSGIYVCEVEH